MEVVIHRKRHFGTENNVRLQGHAGLQRCRIREVSLYLGSVATINNKSFIYDTSYRLLRDGGKDVPEYE